MTLRSLLLAACLAMIAVPCFAQDRPEPRTVLPLTDDHWRNAPPSVIEGETGIPGPVIEEQRRQQHEREPYPSIPGETGSAPTPR